jgi:hypothetical protein
MNQITENTNPDLYTVISIQKGPLENGGNYCSTWVIPKFFENRGAPHVTLGPVPIKIDSSDNAFQSILESKLDLPFDFVLKTTIKVSGGNKSKAFIVSAVPYVPTDSLLKTELFPKK